MSDARLEVTDALGRRIVPISKGYFEIGRRETNDLRLAGSEVSRDHAEIALENNHFVI
ncbi:MAG: FHA domain-containing protein, partial [Acidobacteria bacterium]|nr:FHA domain-containing protein [Acidobacteriota bacterium]MCA1652003.1 FHA domain-containing protein [Acidobacteriota bacterium]